MTWLCTGEFFSDVFHDSQAVLSFLSDSLIFKVVYFQIALPIEKRNKA